MIRSWWKKRFGSSANRIVDRDVLLDDVSQAAKQGVIHEDVRPMIEALIQFRDLTVGDAMVPKNLVDFISIHDSVEKFLPFVIDTAHSRFPVFNESRDDVIGILLSKDLLRYFHQPKTFELRAMLRPAVFVPEVKPLGHLLRDFRAKRNHMAIVVDEYGCVSGVITIEDVIEQIIGDIEDEHDFDETEGNIIPTRGHRYRVKGTTPLEDLNEQFEWDLQSTQDTDTVGGWITQKLGHLPKRGERIDCDNGWRFHVLRADSRRIHTLLLECVRNEN